MINRGTATVLALLMVVMVSARQRRCPMLMRLRWSRRPVWAWLHQRWKWQHEHNNQNMIMKLATTNERRSLENSHNTP